MARIAIFASGNGSNFEAIAANFINDSENEVKLLICDKEKAFVLERAKKFNVSYELIKYQKDERELAENKIIKIVNKNNIDVIFLAGYMKILSPFLLKNISIPIINIHPSILPKYKGINAIEKAFESNDKEIGITIHYVVEEVDSGEIILQEKIPLDREKGLDFIEQEVHQLEHKWYPVIAKKICDKLNLDKKK